MTRALVLKNITKTYPDGKEKRTILDGVDLELDKGDIIAILGPSGSGKSTLLSIVGGLLSADSGELWLNGKQLSQEKPKQWTKYRREEIGFIFQNHHLLPYLTILDQLKMMAKLTNSTMTPANLLALLKD